MYYLRDSVTRLKNIAKTIERGGEEKEGKESKLNFTTVRGNALSAYMDYKAAIEELMYLLDEPDMVIRTANNVMPLVERSLLAAKNPEELKEAIEMAFAPFDGYQEYDRLQIYDCKSSSRLEGNSAGFSEAYTKQLLGGIKGLTRPLKVLNTFAFDGENMLTLKDVYTNPIELYAVDVNQDIMSSDKPKFHRIALGSLKGATISNDVFDVVMVSPPISIEKRGRNVIEKLERDYLQKSMNYVRKDGLFVYAIPVTHLYTEICRYLAKNLKEVQIRMDGRRVYISGYRNMAKDREVDRETHLALRTMMLHYKDKKYQLDQPLEETHIPSKALPVKMFRGSKLDEDEFNAMFESSNATAEFLKDQQVEKLAENTKTPLLPFNVGQLGLILTSGCLDGVIDEGNGFYHAVKGRVIKKRDTSNEVSAERGRINTTEVTSNRVEINAFLPDGTYKCLA